MINSRLHNNINTMSLLNRNVCILYNSATSFIITQVAQSIIHSWFVSVLHSAPNLCTLCQPILRLSTSDKKDRIVCPLTKGTHLACLTVKTHGVAPFFHMKRTDTEDITIGKTFVFKYCGPIFKSLYSEN